MKVTAAAARDRVAHHDGQPLPDDGSPAAQLALPGAGISYRERLTVAERLQHEGVLGLRLVFARRGRR